MKRRILTAAVLLLSLCIVLSAWPGAARADGEPGASPSIAEAPYGNTGIEECREAAAAEMGLLAPDIAPRAIAVDIVEDTILHDATTTYNGDTQIESGKTLNLNGQSLTVNGNLNILGTLHVNNGTLTVNGSVTISGGILQMTEPNGHAVVTGSFSTSGADHTGKLTAGTLEVGRNFFQYSAKAFCPSGTFLTKLTGNVSGRIVFFNSPADSWFGKLQTAGTFKSTSVFSLNLNLSDAATLTYPHLYIQGLMNGKALTVPANTVVAGSLTLGGGTLTSGDNLLVDKAGGILMNNAADRLIVNGGFKTGGLCDFRMGITEIHGNFAQYGVVSGFNDNSYAGLPAHITKIVGTGKSVHFDSPVSSYIGQLDLSAGSLTADSDMSLNFDLTADATLAYPNLYYGGRLNGHTLTVNGNLYARQITLGGGALTVERNFTSAAANCLVMANPADSVLVKGDFIAGDTMDPASMAAGTVEIRGNFSQLRNAAAYTASGAHKTVLSGANKTVSFAHPGQSWFNNLELAPGTTFAAGSVLSVKGALAADTAYPVSTLYFSGSLGGHTLTSLGSLHLFGEVNPAGGTINATGDVALDGKLTMANPADRLICGGAFTGAGEAALSAGGAEFKKSFHYTGTKYEATGAHMTTLSGGANMDVIFDNPAGAWFAQVTVAPGTTFSAVSRLSVKAPGLADMALAAPQLYLQGKLEGRSLALSGNLTVPSNSTLTIGGGGLSVSGSMTVDGLLEMKNASDRVRVGGVFTAKGLDETGKLTDGKLYVRGNFVQSGDGKSFAASGNHATIFNGTGAQTVQFASSNSGFGKLYVLNLYTSFTGIAVNPVYSSDKLKNLTGADGTFVPLFSPGTYDYIYVLQKGDTSTTLRATVDFQNMTLNGSDGVTSLDMAVSGVPYDSAVTQTIDVDAVDRVSTNRYTVKVEQLNTDLSDIGLSAGAGPLSPAFDPDTLLYDVTLPASVEKVTLTPALDNPDSTFRIDGQAVLSKEYALNPGASVSVEIKTTGQDGTSTKTYTVTIRRDKMLTGIDVSTGALSFDSPTANYTVDIAADQPSVTVTPHAAPGCSFTIDGASSASAAYTLALDERKTSVVVATAGSAHFTYNVTVHRLPIISGFLHSPITGAVLSPAFNPTGGAFTLTVPASAVNVNIMPVKVDCSRLTIGGAVKDSELVSLVPGESKTLSIVAEKSSASASFTLTVTKKAIISALAPSQGTLTPAFSPTVYSYTVDIPATSGPVSVAPTLLSGSATVNGAAWNPASPTALDPAPGESGEFKIKGTDGGATSEYTVTVRRQKPVSGIALSTASLTPAFDARTAEYVVSLPTDKASITITPAKTAQCTQLVINNAVQDSVTLTPAIGASATAEIRATGQDGATVTAYTVRVVRRALLDDINLSTGSLSPSFDGGVQAYAVYLPNTRTSVTITPDKSSSCTSFTINGKKVSRIVLKPVAGGASTATIVATGANSSLKQTFTVKVYRICPVTSIKLSTGKLSPAFSMGRTAYTVEIPATVKSVTVTPAKAASCASLTIDGAAVSGKTLSPKIGCSEKAVIAATAVNGRVYTYTVTVKRAALLKGITLSKGTLSPAFDPAAFDYSVTVPASASSVKVTPRKASTGVAQMTINGKKAASVTLTPAIGGSAKAVITLTAKDGKTKLTYTVTVNRQSLLTGIVPTVGTLSPAFGPAVTAYTLMLPADTSTTKYTVAKAATGVKSVVIDGSVSDWMDVAVKPCGAAVSTITVTASDGKTKQTVKVTVKREPIIASIAVAGGALGPAFAPETLSYTVIAPAAAGKVTLTPNKAAACQSFTIDGEAVASKEYNPPAGGSVTATIVGRTAAGTEVTYTVTITRAVFVTNIKTSSASCKLSPAFFTTTPIYTVDVPSSRNSLTIYATKAKTGVKSMTINGKAAASLTVRRPASGKGTTVVTIVATASDGVTKATYTVKVSWK